jgi:phenylacetate-CoA ligase
MSSPPDPVEAIHHPTLSDRGRSMLAWMREHPNAPRFTGHTGSRLCADDLLLVRERAQAILNTPVGCAGDTAEPQWLLKFVDHALNAVPFYRRYGLPEGTSFTDIPTTSRKDFSADIAQFVPDDVDAAQLITYVTSGTTGHPLSVPSHPRVAAEYLAYHRRALHRLGMDLQADTGTVGVVLLGFQRACFTYTSVVPMQGEAGLVKLNLHPSVWRSEADRATYLQALNPEVIAGDPISFAELLRITSAADRPEPPAQLGSEATTWGPRMLFSTSMTLLPGLRAELEDAFDCPVLDFYSMNEAGPIAVFDTAAGGHVLLQRELHVELLDPSGALVPDGQRGEITLTGGFNFCLPLLRYRTGDFASMGSYVRPDGLGVERVLIGLVGREPVRFCTSTGEWINNVDILHEFNPLTLSQFCLHQSVDGSLTLSVQGSARNVLQAKELLRALMGSRTVSVSTIDPAAEKIKQFTSDFPGAMGSNQETS